MRRWEGIEEGERMERRGRGERERREREGGGRVGRGE